MCACVCVYICVRVGGRVDTCTHMPLIWRLPSSLENDLRKSGIALALCITVTWGAKNKNRSSINICCTSE